MTATDQAIELARVAAAAAADKKGTDIRAMDVSEHLAITDIFLLVSAANERQVGAIVDAVSEALAQRGVKAARTEGERENRWVLLDFIDVVVHVQHQEERQTYSLERLWKDCPQVDLGLEETLGGDAVAGAGEPGEDADS